MNARLKKGGHIAYSVRKSKRRHNYTTLLDYITIKILHELSAAGQTDIRCLSIFH